MVPDLKRVGRKAGELAPLNRRRLKKKRFNRLTRKKEGLRKRLKEKDFLEEME